MLNGVFVKTYPPQPFDRREILRYAGCLSETEEIGAALDECLRVCENVFSYRVCYSVWTAECFYEVFGRDGKTVNAHLDGCDYAVIFAGTVGLGIDRLIAKYANVAVSKAVLLQAIGAERIESLCDTFCEEIGAQAKQKGYAAGKRFSAGYGDFPLTAQKEIFGALDCARKIGLTLTDSLLMSPTKSVTAVLGLKKAEINDEF